MASKLVVMLVALSLAQADPPGAEEPSQPDPGHDVRNLLEETKKLGPWEENAAMERDAIQRVFERNGWNSEADQFALSLVTQVNEIPPWQQAERMDVFFDALKGRYDLTPDQTRHLSRMIQRETLRFTINHAADLAPIAMEAIRTRSAGQPYSSEQIAEWCRKFRPIAEEARESVERVCRELSKNLTPEQKTKLNADLNALIRRHNGIMTQMVRWEQGEWNPEDWGMENDPIQRGERLTPEAQAEIRAREAARAAARRPAASQPAPVDVSPTTEHEWVRYVREFVTRNECTDAQKTSAQSILQELLTRSERYRKTSSKQIDSVRAQMSAAKSPAERDKLKAELDRLEAPLKAMFDELKSRLEALLTAEQRTRAAVRSGKAA